MNKQATNTNLSGGCLCGAVRFSARVANHSVGACHCSICRRWSGGPFFEVGCGEDVSFKGLDKIRVYQSSAWAERGFCRICGTHLFIRVRQDNEYGVPPGIGLPAGLFDDQSFEFDHQVFIDQKPPYYTFSNETRNLDSEEIYQLFPRCKPVKKQRDTHQQT